MSEIPSGWFGTSLSNIAKITMGQSPSGEYTNTDGIGLPLVGGAADFKDGKINTTRYTSKPTKISEIGDIILCIRATIGKLAFADEVYCLGRGVASFQSYIEPKWLFYKLLEIAKELDAAGTGTTFRQIDKKTLEKWPIKLPPHLEQIRIVQKIETLILKLDEVKNHIKNIPLLIDKYKQAVLISGFNGELTLKWRAAQNSETYNNNRQSSLPHSWNLISLGEIAEIQTGLALGKKRKLSERTTHKPYLRVANVQRGYLDLSEIKYTEVNGAEFEKLRLIPGDILMNEGGDRDKLGRGWVWKGEIADCIHQNHVFRVRLKDRNFPPSWVSFYANEFGQKYFFEKGQQTTNLASISKTKLSALPIPIPPVDEAIEIIRRFEKSFSWLTGVESEVRNALKLTDNLLQAILEKAFRGELLLQKSTDEPAVKLLENIELIREAEEETKPKRKIKIESEVKSMVRKLKDVLVEAQDWLPAQEAFRLCGISHDATTEEIEPIYSELRSLDLLGHIDIETIRDEGGKKTYDRIKLNQRASHAS